MNDPDTELSKAYNRLLGPKQTKKVRGTLAIFLPKKILQALPLKRNVEIRLSNEIIRHFCWQSIQRARKQLAIQNSSQSGNILSIALGSHAFDDEELIDQLMTFLAAGHETTAQTLSWAVYFLCKHPHTQDQLRSEVQAHLPALKTGHPIDSACFDDLPYLQAVCNETLRLMPVVPMLYRQAAEPTSILGCYIPSGTVVAMSPWIMNRSQHFWGPDADSFNPQRWIGQEGPIRNGMNTKYGFMTFSHGPRACIGQAFARAELSALLAGIIGNFECELENPAYNAAPSFSIVLLRPANGIKVLLKKTNEC